MARSNRKKIVEDNLDGYLFDPTEGVPHSVVPSPQILNPDDVEGADSCEDIARNLGPRKGPSPDHADTIILDFQPPEW